MASVRLRNISKTYDGITNILNDINLEIADGDFVVLLGDSGCGKTTTLNMIAGLDSPNSGDIYIDDKCVTKVEPYLRDVAMVFQNYALYPHLSVCKNLSFALQIQKKPKSFIDERVDYIANLLNIQELLDRKPHQLSGGQMQRVAIGKALVRNPSVFLFDEPFSNLDSSLRSRLRSELKKIHNTIGGTFIFVTHDKLEALELATKIVILCENEIIQVGTPMDVYFNPNNLYVALFFGSDRANVIEDTEIHTLIDITLQQPFVCYVRPEAFRISTVNTAGAVNSEIIEILLQGDTVLITCKLSEKIIVVVKAMASQEILGLKRCYITLDADKVLYFEKDSKKRIYITKKGDFYEK